ncbi:MAG: FtsW/RodA/SpoVE family cell cycle protein [Verrucomicrobia bacterium]|nr:FtsW/RodA/SpoVE family cell cycle protein [Verrucomicrobiota bacterium]
MATSGSRNPLFSATLLASLIMVSVLVLAATGVAMLFSIAPLDDPTRFVGRQLVALVLGGVGAVWIARLPTETLRKWSPYLLGIALVLLVLVLIPGVGSKVNGARRWLRLAGLQFQPSDFAKLAAVLALAHYGAYYQRLMRSFWTGVVFPGTLLLLVCGLIFVEPDWGTAVLIGTVGVALLISAGARWYFFALPLIVAGVAVGALLVNDPVRWKRIEAYLNPEKYRTGAGYQVYMSWLALGSGGPEGKGFDQSTLKPLVSEHQTDFIFAIYGEEFGFRGSLLLLGAYLLVLVCGLGIARRAPDHFGMLLATGITLLIVLQALINIGVVTGAIPNKGIALPFVSYGGSGLMMMFWGVGLLLSVARSAAEATAAELAALGAAAEGSPA